MELQFSLMQLIEESQSKGVRFIYPDKSAFDSLPSSFSYLKDKIYYRITIERTDNYICFAFDYGNSEPRDENLTNTETGETRKNPREPIETELNQQLFFLYYYSKNLLYISNSKRKNLLSEILKEQLQIDFIIKELFKNKEDFINTLQVCKNIKFTHAKNLFNIDSVKRKALQDLTGTDAPESFTIEAGYKDHSIRDFIRELMNEHGNGNIDGLVINGLDNEGFRSVFNIKTFIQKITISCDKDENGKFISSNVFNNLLREIER